MTARPRRKALKTNGWRLAEEVRGFGLLTRGEGFVADVMKRVTRYWKSPFEDGRAWLNRRKRPAWNLNQTRTVTAGEPNRPRRQTQASFHTGWTPRNWQSRQCFGTAVRQPRRTPRFYRVKKQLAGDGQPQAAGRNRRRPTASPAIRARQCQRKATTRRRTGREGVPAVCDGRLADDASLGRPHKTRSHVLVRSEGKPDSKHDRIGPK